MKNEYIIGNFTQHLLLAYAKKIPVIVTSFEYLPFEMYSRKMPIEYNPSEISIEGKGTGFSQEELRRTLLFFLELHGLLIIKDVFSIQLEHDKKKFICYNKLLQTEICYEKLYILDSHKISYNVLPSENSNKYKVIDKYKVDEKNNKYFRKGLYELYFFDGYLYIVFNALHDLLEDWTFSFSYIRRELQLEDMEYCGREIRPLFVRRIAINDGSIQYEVS